MIRGILICPDKELGDRLNNALQATRRMNVVRTINHYPDVVELTRVIRAMGPQVMVIGIEDRQAAFDVAVKVESLAPGMPLVAVSRTLDSQVLLEAMRVGIREYLAPPFELGPLNDALDRIAQQAEAKPMAVPQTDSLYAFLPAKAGAGTTTIAVNTATAMAKMTDEKVLLMDMDLNCGLVGFMMLIESQYSILDAAENALEMDENLWPKIVTTIGALDVLPVGKMRPGFRIESVQVRHILDYSRRNYGSVCIDLSGMMEKYTMEVLHEAKRVFLVCTPELPSLHLAREKISFLKSMDLHGRVSILLNRAQKRMQISELEMEKLFGMPIHMTFPNDYTGVHKALTAGKQVDTSSDLGKRYRELAETLITRKGDAAAAPEKKKGLMGLLS